MATEQFANNAASTLASAINDSVTSLTVASATLFPSTGNFRIRIDNEIMTVTGVASTTFTVTRGTSPASHAQDAVVTQVLSAGGLAAHNGDNVARGLFTATDTDNITGRLYLPTDAQRFLRNTGATWSSLLSAFNATSPPSSGSFTWANQRAMTITESKGSFVVNAGYTNGLTSGECGYLYYNMPARPYTLTMCFDMLQRLHTTVSTGAGIQVIDSGASKATGIAARNTTVRYIGQGSQATFTSALASTGANAYYIPWGSNIWLRLVDDNTNFMYYYSPDGYTWTKVHQAGRTAYLASPDKVGMCFMHSTEAAGNPQFLVHYWSQT